MNYVEAAMDTILMLKDEVIFWPDAEERSSISQFFDESCKFINCIGIVDGTLFPLEYKPAFNGEDYFIRKGSYAIHSLIFCDQFARIRGLTLGWPGSVHDNRVWSRSKYKLNSNDYFDQKQYLIGDYAFKPSNIMVPSYKKLRFILIGLVLLVCLVAVLLQSCS